MPIKQISHYAPQLGAASDGILTNGMIMLKEYPE